MTSKLLKHARLRAEMTQQEAATAIGISRQALVGYESGAVDPRAGVLIKLLDCYGMPNDLRAPLLKGTP